MSDDRNCGRKNSRASRVICGMSVRRGRLCTRANRSETSSLLLWTTGATMCEGGSLSLICRMYSPRSVSTTFTPAASRWRLSAISSETIDFDLVTLATSWRLAISTTSFEASSGVSAQSTVAPRAVACASKRSSQTSRLASARLRRSTASSRVASKSSSSAIALVRPTVQRCESTFRFCCNRTSASFCPLRALKCIDWTCISAPLA